MENVHQNAQIDDNYVLENYELSVDHGKSDTQNSDTPCSIPTSDIGGRSERYPRRSKNENQAPDNHEVPFAINVENATKENRIIK